MANFLTQPAYSLRNALVKHGTKLAVPEVHAKASDYATQLLKEIIPINTTSSPDPELATDTRAGTRHMGDYLQNIGAEVQFSDDYEYPAGSGAKHNSMVAVFWPKDAKKRALPAQVWSSHIDTVPALEDWVDPQTNKPISPYVAQHREDGIYGRGAIDLKGPGACVLGSLRALKEAGKLDDLQRPLAVAITSNEESGLQGAEDIAPLIKKMGITPGEFCVVEPSEGYIGTGFKGGLQEELTFHAAKETGSTWPHHLEITIQTAGGHSSIQGGTMADPAFVASRAVLPLVESFREKGVPMEVSTVRYGRVSNIVGGKMVLTIGFGRENSKTQEVEQAFAKELGEIEQSANKKLRKTGKIVNGIQQFRDEVGNLQFGSLAISAAPAKSEPAVRKFLSDDTKASSSPAEETLRTVREIYNMNDQGKRALGEGFGPIPTLGSTKLGVSIIQATEEKGRLIFDARYPQEAEHGTDKIPSIASIAETIHRTAERQGTAKPEIREMFHIPPQTTRAPIKVRTYSAIARATGLLDHASDSTNIPSGADTNVLAQHFPNALFFNFSGGGFAQNIHGVDEHITHEQIQHNTAFYTEIMHHNCIAQERAVIR